MDYNDWANDGASVESEYLGVRPAFKLNLRSKIGDKIIIGKTACTVIYENYALSDVVVCMHRFDAIVNDFEKSEIKRFINSEEFKKKL